MWWAERPGAEAGRLLLVLRSDSLDVGWLPAQAGARWQTLQLAILPPPDASGAPAALAADAAASAPATPPERNAAALQAALCQLQARLAEPLPGLRIAGQRRLTVLVAAPWLPAVAMPWSDALLQSPDDEVHARSELQARGLVAAADDLLRIDARPPRGRLRTVLLVPAWLLPALQALALASGARLASVQSLEAVAAGWAARQAVAASSPLIGLLAGASLHLRSPDGTPAQAAAEGVDGDPASAAQARAVRLWQRARWRFPALQAQPVLPVLMLDEAPVSAAAADSAPAAAGDVVWLPWPPEDGRSRAALDRALLQQACARATLDALPAPAARSPLWLGAAALLLAGALVLGWQAGQSQHLLAQPARAGAPPAAAAAAALGRAELAEIKAVNAAVRQLNLPLPLLLRTLQPPRDIQVALLGLDLAGPGGGTETPSEALAQAASLPGAKLKLTLEAASAPDMTRYVDFLADRDGIAAAQLVRHEVDAAASALPYRFTVELAWQR